MSKEKDRQPFISVRDLKKYFCLDNYKIAKAKTRYIHAVDDVSFDIYKGEIFGIIGESGSGKSTIGRCVLKLIDVDSGEIYFDGKNITHVSRKEQQELRSRMQMVFQNPLASFDPKKTIRFSLEESAKVHKIKPEVYKARIKQLMEYIALPEDLLTRYPKDLSGGQLQRLAIARALMLEPDFILADEPVSALDVSVQAQILNLMLDLKEDKGQTILFISHDLNVVRHVCDRIAVVYLGAVMEMGTVEQVYNSVAHSYTQALISAKDKWDSTIAESDVYTQDYDKVKECLAKSKYPDGFEFDFYTTSQTQKQAELLKSMVDASGSITMNLVEVPDSDIFSYMFGYKTKDNGERYYNAVGTYMMSDFLDPMGMLKTLYAGSNACEGGTNETLWTSTEADGLLDKAAQTTDDAEKMGYYTDAYKIFADECPYLGLYTSSDVYAVSDKFTYDPSPMFWYNFSYADVHVAK